MPRVEEEVLRRIVPSEEEERRLRAVVEEVISRVRKRLEALAIDAVPVLAGSVAKGTHLTHTEIDVFVAFPPDTPRKELEELGLEVGAFLEDRRRMYAEHPYTRGRWGGFDVEVVPCYRLVRGDQQLSAVDRTPLHTEYVRSHLPDDRRDDVRLLKAFADGIGVYGAEARVQGFSGYLCELLVVKHGTFRAVLEAAAGWRAGLVLELDTPAAKAFDDPLVLVDPVDGGRNVASAVSETQLARFVHAAREFLREPRLAFFFPPPVEPLPVAELKRLRRERGTDLLGVLLPLPNVTEDILYPQLRKALKAMEEVCRRHDFRVANGAYAVVDGDALFLLEFEVFRLPLAQKHPGPPVWVKNADDFRRKWEHSKRTLAGPYIEAGRWVVDVRRPHRTARDLLEGRMGRLSLGKNLDAAARKDVRFLLNDALIRPAYRTALTEFLTKGFPWERATA
jgi:tRNA nucleotidyltransferase (CCA-adding enzyme)